MHVLTKSCIIPHSESNIHVSAVATLLKSIFSPTGKNVSSREKNLVQAQKTLQEAEEYSQKNCKCLYVVVYYKGVVLILTLLRIQK